MKILLDECVDWRLAHELAGHEVSAVYEMGWAGITNGELLSLAAGQFDVFLTVDRNLSFQQPIQNFAIAVVILRAPTNRLSDLKRLIPQVLTILPEAQAGKVTELSSNLVYRE